jgi:ElaB/YqjD/DUF883 family membrane-anchored ribosome-binding protein
LTEKLEALEQKVKDTFGDAKSAVVETVETVKQSVDSTVRAAKDKVHGTVDSVKDALDLRGQVQRQPWAMLAGSVAAGYVLGRLVSQQGSVNGAVTRSSVEASPPQLDPRRRLLDFHPARTGSPSLPSPVAEHRVPEPSLFSELTENFAPEIQKLKGLAIGTLMALARDTIKRSVAPPLGLELERVIDRVTTKLGGLPVAGPGPELPRERAFATNGAGK